jgi:peptidoglycan/LPS O-acetylase OafA/YrhL
MARIDMSQIEDSMVEQQATAKRSRLCAVQILRAVAALLVVFGHTMYEARSLDPDNVHLAAFEGEHWQVGVDLFFIISGFIMMWSFGDRFGQAYAPREFLVRRFVRILPAYWLFTSLIVLATLLTPSRLENAMFDPEHALLSFLLVPHIAPHGGIHPILALGWTLMYEAFFYICFASCLCLPRRIGLATLVAIFFLAYGLATFTHFLPEALRRFWGDSIMFEFLLGVAIYFALPDGRLSARRLIGILAICAAMGTAAWLTSTWSSIRVWHYGLPALALFVFTSAALPQVTRHFWLLLILVGEASYTLYLSHPFVLEVVKMAFERIPFLNSAPILYISAAIAVATVFSIAFYKAIETNLARWLMRLRVLQLQRAS